MSRIRNRIHYLVFFLFFVYTASPLSLTFEYKPWAQVSVSGVRLMIVDLLISKLAGNKDEDKSSSSVNFLLKKKRATLTTEKLKLSKKHVKSEAIVSENPTVSRASCIASVVEKNKSAINKGFYLSYSGLSPPAA